MIYEITTYTLTDKTIHLFKERPELKINGENGVKKKFIDFEGTEHFCGPRSKFSTNLNIDKNYFSENEFPKFLPYFADVTEDIHSKFNIEPSTWKGCQLMTETHGGYLQFYSHDTKKVLRIAMNSNIYTPIK